MQESGDGEDEQREQHRRDGGVHHVADVFEEGRSGRRRSQDGRIRKGRYLVAEIGSGDDGTGRPPHVEPLRVANTHQRDADGGDGGPRTAGHHRDDGANHARRRQKEGGAQDLHPIIYQRRHHAAYHPAPR